ncbi:potassium-transporting ATPase subunit KdpC [Desulforegula conservatrix]|uniref:potassium-transporting ATPase subunit KdpC n=1 Tax=Desulforegula conservatrix TaxID=153026 RepID=UPI000417B10F|nr:potassium-transporting ATPase subunit KdpC [Desulforegula conservatrix]
MKNIIIALRVAIVTLILTGIIYPLAVTGIAQVIFPDKANGSMIKNEKGETVGSKLIAQAFSKPSYFQPRPSAAGNGYDASSSGGSNLGPSSQKLRERIKTDTERLIKENPDAKGPVPVELVMASASGLDPHISTEAAMWQIPRIAKSRNADPEMIKKIIENTTEGRDLFIFGEPRVNVLRLNMALDKKFGKA